MGPFWSPSSESTEDSSDEDVPFESPVASSASLSYLCRMPVEEERSARPDVCARKEKRMWRKLLHPKVISEVSVSLPVKGLTSTPLLKLPAFSPSTLLLMFFILWSGHWSNGDEIPGQKAGLDHLDRVRLDIFLLDKRLLARL